MINIMSCARSRQHTDISNLEAVTSNGEKKCTYRKKSTQNLCWCRTEIAKREHHVNNEIEPRLTINPFHTFEKYRNAAYHHDQPRKLKVSPKSTEITESKVKQTYPHQK